ncbi:MAG: carbohydrate porin, partial [Rhodothermales bacterium]
VVLDGVPGSPDDPLGTHVVFGDEDGLLVAAEAAYFFGPQTEPDATPTNRHVRRIIDPPYRAKIALGAWTYTRASEPIGSASSGNVARGAYVLAESDVYRERTDTDQGLSVFARAGLADDRVLRFGAYTGLGAVYRGPFGGRDADELGLAVAAVHNDASYKQALRETGRAVAASEVNLEATYLAALAPWLALQADLQYILNPDTDPSLSNSLLATLRLQVSL